MQPSHWGKPYLNISASHTQGSVLERTMAAMQEAGVLVNSLLQTHKGVISSLWTSFLPLRPDVVEPDAEACLLTCSKGISKSHSTGCRKGDLPLWHFQRSSSKLILFHPKPPLCLIVTCTRGNYIVKRMLTDLETKIFCRYGLFQQEIKMNAISWVNALRSPEIGCLTTFLVFWETSSLIDSQQLSRSAEDFNLAAAVGWSS